MTTDFPRLKDAIENGMAIGQHLGAVIHLRRAGEIVADFAIGDASLDPQTPLKTEQKLLWLSAGKPLTALAIGILSDRGQLRFHDPVCAYIPDFAQNGKEKITIRHVLMQAHSYKPPRIDWPRQPREKVIETICAAEMFRGGTPGEFAAYDPQTGWYLLSEIVARITRSSNHVFVKEELLAPLGCEEASIGMSAGEWTAEQDAGNLVRLYDTTQSARENTNLLELEDASASGDAVLPRPWVGDDANRAEAHNPGGGALGPARDLAAVYQCLLDDGRTPDGTVILRDSTVKEMTTRQRIGLKDHTFKQVIDWGLGFLVNSARYGALALPYGYGRHASDDTFGHGGMQSSTGFADPDNQLCGAIIFNGLPGEPKHQKRIDTAMTALYEDLGITG